MARAYFATKLSEHLAKTPEGFLVATDCIIARDGFQRYAVSDLPQDRAKELGVDLSNGNAFVDLYRPHDEVFSPATIASFNGKIVTDDHPHEGFVDTTNVQQHNCGHAQNIRKGWETLESGDWPMLADLVITDASLINKVEKGLRELSCGYEYTLDAKDKLLLQTGIIGNHVAVVPRGRAGPEARINDSAPVVEVQPPAAQPKTEEVKPAARQIQKKGEYMPKSTIKDLIGRGFRALASDESVSHEALTDAALAAHRITDSEPETPEERRAKEEKDAADRRARDEEEKKMKDAAAEEEKKKEEDRKVKDAADKKARDEAEEKEKKEKEEKDARDKAARDAAEGQHHMACKVKDCMDRDCRMHHTLDAILKEHPKENQEDADMSELMDIMGQFKGGAGGDASEVIEPIVEGETDAGDPDVTHQPGILPTTDRALAADAKAEHEFLKKMRPVVAREFARTGDHALKNEFNARLSKFTRSSRPGTGSYGGAAAAAGARVGVHDNKERDYSALQAQVDAIRTGKSLEVK